jgi:hypothetical protein
MAEPITISVFEVVGSSLCVASDDGQKVHDQIDTAFKQGRRVVLSFRNVEGLTSAFLNAAVGQLYGAHTEDFIRANLTVADMAVEDLALLKRVVDTAKLYFKNPQRFVDAVRDATGETPDEPSGN